LASSPSCPRSGFPFVAATTTTTKEVAVSRVIVIQFVSLDGVVEDPDGTQGTQRGGWAFRYGPESVAGDKFALGEIMQTGALLLGRATWELFAQIWPTRSDDFSTRMNAMRKLVASRSLRSVDAWSNSTLLRGDLVEEVRRRKSEQDLVVAGSGTVVRTLIEHDLVDEYRLLVFPLVLGEGRRLFDGETAPIDLRLAGCEQAGATVRLVYERA
jgi:dihydrofolate reductase